MGCIKLFTNKVKFVVAWIVPILLLFSCQGNTRNISFTYPEELIISSIQKEVGNEEVATFVTIAHEAGITTEEGGKMWGFYGWKDSATDEFQMLAVQLSLAAGKVKQVQYLSFREDIAEIFPENVVETVRANGIDSYQSVLIDRLSENEF